MDRDRKIQELFELYQFNSVQQAVIELALKSCSEQDLKLIIIQPSDVRQTLIEQGKAAFGSADNDFKKSVIDKLQEILNEEVEVFKLQVNQLCEYLVSDRLDEEQRNLVLKNINIMLGNPIRAPFSDENIMNSKEDFIAALE